MEKTMRKVLSLILTTLLMVNTLPNVRVYAFGEDTEGTATETTETVTEEISQKEEDVTVTSTEDSASETAEAEKEVFSEEEQKEEGSDLGSVHEAVEEKIAEAAEEEQAEEVESKQEETVEVAEETETTEEKASEKTVEENTTEETETVNEVHEVNQKAESGNVVINVTYPSDAFDGDVTLVAREITSSDKDYEDVASKLEGKEYDSFRAFDISFKDQEGQKAEPKKDVNVQITIDTEWAKKDAETSLLHIASDGELEPVKSEINEGATEILFANDDFSVYVVTTKSPEELGNVVVGDQTFTTLAEAVAAASEGDTINIIGETADTEAVAIEKSLTILSDGEDGYLPKGLDANAGTITLGGGSNTLKMGAVWSTSEDTMTLNIEDGVHVTGSLPVYFYNGTKTLNIHGGTIEQTVARDNWNTAVGIYDGTVNMTGGTIKGIGDGIYCYDTIE